MKLILEIPVQKSLQNTSFSNSNTDSSLLKFCSYQTIFIDMLAILQTFKDFKLP